MNDTPNDTPNEWEALFGALDEVFTNVSSLLRDAERMLETHGYVIDHKTESSIGAERSGSIHSPTHWYPGWISRHFRLKADPTAPTVFICVLLHARANDDFDALEQPMVSAGVLRPSEGASHALWMTKAWAWGKRRPADGTRKLVEFKNGGSAEVFARPLASMTDASALKRKIVGALVELAKPKRVPR